MAAPIGAEDGKAEAMGLVSALLVCAGLGLAVLHQAFAEPWVVPWDGRQHVWWMQRLLDADLFPADFMADYFSAVAPPGYVGVYAALAAAGIGPMVACKLLPLAIGLLATFYVFRLAWAIYPDAFAASLAATAFAVRTWTQSDVPSGTARAWFQPLIAAFLYYLAIGARGPCLATIALMGVLYPQTALLALTVLGLRLVLAVPAAARGAEARFLVLAAGVAGVTIAPFALATGAYGPVATWADARTMPEWAHLFRWQDGLVPAWRYWVLSEETGLMAPHRYWAVLPFLALALPWMRRRPAAFPALARLRPGVVVLPLLAGASLALFAAAHAALFRLYLPARYTQHTLWLAMFVGSAIVVAAAIEASTRTPRLKAAWRVAAVVVTCLPLLGAKLAGNSMMVGRSDALYRYVHGLPKDAVIATLSVEGDYLPSFTGRSVHASDIGYNGFHLGFTRVVRPRVVDLVRAQYAPDAAALRAFVRRYRPTHLLLDHDAFSLDYLERNGLANRVVPRAELAAVARALRRRAPYLLRAERGRIVFDDGRHALYDVRDL